jgi:hypothetical protein
MYLQRRRGIQYPRVEDTSPSIRWDRVLAEAGNSVVKRSPDCNHFLSRGETSDRLTAGAPLTEHSNEVGGGVQSSPPRQSSPASWSGNSSPNQSGGAAFEPPSHHPEDDDNTGDE